MWKTKKCIYYVKKYRACVVGMPSKDTIKVVDEENYAVRTPERKSGLSFCHNTTPLIFLLRTWQADAEESFHALAQIKWNEWVNIILSGNGFVKYDAGDGQ